jgi:para-aminobenzoate synthetase component 1
MNCVEIKPFFNEDDFIAAFGEKEGFFILDSGNEQLDISNYSFIGLSPCFHISYSRKGTIKNNKLLKIPFLEFIRQELAKNKREEGLFPFCSGFMGYLGYDFGWELDKFRSLYGKKKIYGMPLAKFYYYDTVFIIDKKKMKLFCCFENKKPDLNKVIGKLSTACEDKTMFSAVKLVSSISRKKYRWIIEKTKEYISKGDIYQANIAQRFHCDFRGKPSSFYRNLRTLSPAPFGAYFVDKDFAVLSNSPERFLYRKDSYIETRPIKGTRKRHSDETIDNSLVKALMESEKDRAEHIMIVDLERNDLGKICQKGTVYVKDLMRIESYANVHHMVSIISGKLNEDVDFVDCINATFPGGSITGAPKLRSMQIIDELEPVSRGIYCGSIGYIDNSGNFDFNIAIRTGIIYRNKLYFYVGGGIVADSDPDEEFEETIIKARSVMTALGMSKIKD